MPTGTCRNFTPAQERIQDECQLGAGAIFHMPSGLYTVCDSLEQIQFSAILEARTR